jgi:hypothetical protein
MASLFNFAKWVVQLPAHLPPNHSPAKGVKADSLWEINTL